MHSWMLSQVYDKGQDSLCKDGTDLVAWKLLC